MATKALPGETGAHDPPSEPMLTAEDVDEYVRMCRSIGRASRRLSRLAAQRGASTLVARLEAVVIEARALQGAHAASDAEGSEARAGPPSSELDFAIDHLMVARVLMPEAQQSVRQAIEMALYLLAHNAEVRGSS